MIPKVPILKNRIRKVPKQFSWVDQRLVRDRHIERLSHPAAALYLFWVTVSDAKGLSYDRHQDFEDPDHPRQLLILRKKARDQKMYMRFLSLSPKAEQYYYKLEQRRMNPKHHVQKIVTLSEIYASEAVKAPGPYTHISRSAFSPINVTPFNVTFFLF
jgi:hypothetical protein